MHRRTKQRLAAGVGTLVAVVGAGGAIAATRATSPSEQNRAIVEDVAEELGVTPARVTDALRQALENRVDEAVEAGRLTEAQGAELKERLQSDDVPLLRGPLFGHGPGHLGRPGGRGFARLEPAAAYLGVTQAELRESLRAGDALAEIAAEAGKSVDGLVDALVAEQTERLDEAVAAGRISAERRDQLAAGLEERVTALVNGERPLRPGYRARGSGGKH